MPGREEKSGDMEMKFNIPPYLEYMLEVSEETYITMHAAIDERNNPTHGPQGVDEEDENAFRAALRELFMIYEPKFSHSSKDYEVDEIRETMKEKGVDALSFEECKELAWAIRKLQESLGHTKFVRTKHKDRGVGKNKR